MIGLKTLGLWGVPLVSFTLFACQKKEEAKVQNAVTEYVDRGVATMDKAEVNVDKMNKQSAQMEAANKSISE